MKDSVAAHYSHGQLLDRILRGLKDIGKTPESVTVEELAPVDEFHIGGRQASEDFIRTCLKIVLAGYRYLAPRP